MWKNNGKHNIARRKDHWRTNSRGYVEGYIWVDDRRIYTKQHRLVMEQHLGRPLRHEEDIHHINGNRADNRIENLRLIEHGEHTGHHSRRREHPSGYKQNLSPEQRAARSRQMSEMHRSGRM